MLLSDMALPMKWSECKDLALVYSYDVAVSMYAIQQEHGDPRHVAVGKQLTDGRWMMFAEVLSEMYPGGIVGWACEHLTPEIMEQIDILPLAEVLPQLTPEPQPEEPA